jgi:hypothetical protein
MVVGFMAHLLLSGIAASLQKNAMNRPDVDLSAFRLRGLGPVEEGG